jgi:hypothetical protein
MTTHKCAACHRQVSSGIYCLEHNKAFESLNKHYKSWMDAYDDVSWQDFLNNILGRNETGKWVKEVIAIELEK